MVCFISEQLVANLLAFLFICKDLDSNLPCALCFASENFRSSTHNKKPMSLQHMRGGSKAAAKTVLCDPQCNRRAPERRLQSPATGRPHPR